MTNRGAGQVCSVPWGGFSHDQGRLATWGRGRYAPGSQVESVKNIHMCRQHSGSLKELVLISFLLLLPASQEGR